MIEDGRKILRVNGVIQSVHVDASYLPDVWDAMLPDEAPRNALILGLGGGTMAQLLTTRFGMLPITGVERDPAVIWLARHEFGLALAPNVRIEHQDAFMFVRRCEEAFDFIAVDLYTAGKMAHGVLGAAFLRDVRRLLTPDGLATFNLWRSPYLDDQIRRLARVFAIRSTAEVDDNIVVRCGHLAR
jgi:spermidine synthase